MIIFLLDIMSLVAFKIFPLVLSDIDISEHHPFFYHIVYLFLFGHAGSTSRVRAFFSGIL